MMKILNHLWMITSVIFIYTLTGLSQNSNSESWSQFRGPHGDGVSTEDLSQINWAETQPTRLWKKEIGPAFSELIVSEGVVFTMASEQTDSISGFEFVAAYEEDTGDELWRSNVDSIFIEIDGWGHGSRSTPTVDELNIYSLSANGKLTANSKKDGNRIWQLDLVKAFGSTCPRWGYSSSPILVDNQLIMEVGGTDSSAFMSFDKTNGNTIWASANGNASYNSPLLVTIDGQEQIIFANGQKLVAYTSQGDTLWSYTMPFGNIIASPVFIGPNKIFLSGIRNPGFIIVQIEENKATELIHGNSMKNDFSSCLYYNGYIYGFHVASLRCISAETGKVKWTKRGFGKGSLILVDNKLLVLSDQGKLAVVEATPDSYIENGSIQSISGKSWTAPSFQDGKIYVRNLTEAACYTLK
ncbi:MAG: PQQ-binding-like beta-propeller repeat protein [Bacteroidales bacterium]|nr:PQQ-binding-like beta-propeller repeat protein [Bacteroidota bacterium]MBL6949320.1 PQQ-binding-like beta-propeller repeat protein [Bacteroidales bacterium]